MSAPVWARVQRAQMPSMLKHSTLYARVLLLKNAPPSQLPWLSMEPQQALTELLQGLRYQATASTPVVSFTQKLLQTLDEQLAALPKACHSESDWCQWLEARTTLLTREGGAAWKKIQASLRQNFLRSHPIAMAPIHDMALALDGLLQFVHTQALNELEAMRFVMLAQAQQGLATVRQKKIRSHSSLNRSREVSIARLRSNINRQAMPLKTPQSARKNNAAKQEAARRHALENTVAALNDWEPTPHWAHAQLCMFARGGYGRGELCFDSDLDLGSCIVLEEDGMAEHGATGSDRAYSSAKTLLLREVVVRMQEILRAVGLNPAHQYFELGEDLSRFTKPKTLHTLTSILEGRNLGGDVGILSALRQQVWDIFPSNAYIEKKMQEFSALALQPSGGGGLRLKNGQGGLRAIQNALWLAGATWGSSQGNFHPASLLQTAHKKGLLSVWECAHLGRTLELAWVMRAANSAHHTDFTQHESSKRSQQLFDLAAAKRNRVAMPPPFTQHPHTTNPGAGWCLLHQLLQQAHNTAKTLIQRALEPTTLTQLSHVTLHIYPAQRHILAIEATTTHGVATPAMQASLLQGIKATPKVLVPPTITRMALLETLAHAAQAGLCFSPALQDALCQILPHLPLAKTLLPALTAEENTWWQQILLAPHAMNILEQTCAISNPFDWHTSSLLGCFLPVIDSARKYPQGPYQSHTALHQTAFLALAQIQIELNSLAEEYPQWHEMLRDEDILALKCAALLHVCCYFGAPESHPNLEGTRGIAAMEDLAKQHQAGVECLQHGMAQMGFTQQGMREKATLLVLHHRSLVLLGNKGYTDEALAHCFALVEQRLETLLLLFMMNLAALGACGPLHYPQQQALRDRFARTCMMLEEMRGFPNENEALELINQRLDVQKNEQQYETRFQLMVQKCIEQGMGPALYAPLRQHAPDVWQQLQGHVANLEALQLQVTMGDSNDQKVQYLEKRFAERMQALLPQPTLLLLSQKEGALLDWFFHAFPNRHLMRCPPAILAKQSMRFEGFRSHDVLVDSMPNSATGLTEILIFTRNLKQSHTRVAYALSRRSVHAINIVNGKFNPVRFKGGATGYCYAFQTAAIDSLPQSWNRDMEWSIRNVPPPLLTPPTLSPSPDVDQGSSTPGVDAFPSHRAAPTGAKPRIHFYTADDKSYAVQETPEGYQRKPTRLPYIHIQLHDAPFVFYQLSQLFDAFQVEVPQATLANVGREISDHFYMDAQSHHALQNGTFVLACQRVLGHSKTHKSQNLS